MVRDRLHAGTGPRLRTRHRQQLLGVLGLLALLAAVDQTTELAGLPGHTGHTGGLGAVGWAVALTCGLLVHGWVARSLVRWRRPALGAADLITLGRATLACAAAGLAAATMLGSPRTPVLVGLVTLALLLDAVDGPVARRTRSVSVFGGRFDGEADAFLMLVLSAYLAATVGVWVLAIGVMRYAFGAAGWAWPWLRADLPFRYWRKVVTAVQGIVLTVAAAAVLPPLWTYAALGGALALLVESFARDVVWLWRRRPTARIAPVVSSRHGTQGLRSATSLSGSLP
ncbi:MAG TPA: CDP-alcohol phosphatidyltransferase family protein [Nocardioidaceae bacterium]|nr:CDP-alcohol phosphatidyltransferase family protein [Nocardioidaceae bacterium]